MKLSILLQPWLASHELRNDVQIQGIQNDSRKVNPGDLFIAYPGALADGRDFMIKAAASGAAAIVYEAQDNYLIDPSGFPCPLIPIPGLAAQLAVIASRYFQTPSSKLSVTGVTGTNGKTTIAYQLAQAHDALGQPSVYLGTIGEGKINALQTLINTTPDALQLQAFLHGYVQREIQHVCMEVSSHALSQKRADCIDFKQAIFTNLTHDHLDFHGNMEAYAKAKSLLFAVPSLQCAVINADDPYSFLMCQAVLPNTQILRYGMKEDSDVRARSWQMDKLGSRLQLTTSWGDVTLRLPALGQFNLYNSMAVFASLMASQQYDLPDVVDVMSTLKSAPGRMEIVAERPCVIVDYAHTPDALENVLLTVKALKPHKLWVVFGCGGDRDNTKRPKMGKIASLHADEVIITNDNPRTEDPAQIAKEILQGLPNGVFAQTILDRKQAILQTISQADAEDIIVIAGKGHENYQIIGSQRLSFSDQTVVQEYFAAKACGVLDS